MISTIKNFWRIILKLPHTYEKKSPTLKFHPQFKKGDEVYFQSFIVVDNVRRAVSGQASVVQDECPNGFVLLKLKEARYYINSKFINKND
jgi:hypothetical protein